jgi:hypothetical protein
MTTYTRQQIGLYDPPPPDPERCPSFRQPRPTIVVRYVENWRYPRADEIGE